ncbi:hypothetical protein [Streptomyces albireticuli]|uniref:FtsK domain-containing protein n=1 Tax=Streptomyces albireticuli TaxID=1940 RepID=A0A2A2D7D4_9ACTN|nr:hypothetical protein [Streptomyces albireticuli]MCD9143171.1 hypothetical protein [Streptomyces albireticuli]MCD9163613.1 hypothetical protein [Streptomyces albireticuli]MCD9191288.1 hypothetical protein [Streptomyces albireticuli]PAU47250.1 hypothetical protein CK936_19670 [Streptomyces albireticuli]
MGRRALPSSLSDGASLARGREFARTAADNAADMLHPLLTIGRGLHALGTGGLRRWARTPRDRRGPTLLLAASCVVIVALLPYGPTLSAVVLMAAAAWAGRDRGAAAAADTVDEESCHARLRTVYESLVPYLTVPEDPEPLYAHGGDWRRAFTEYEFDHLGRLVSLQLRYPAYFTDGEPESRAKVEQLLRLKAGRGREYRFDWEEEDNHLTLSALAPLPTDIRAQRFVTVPGEAVLGFTDPCSVQRTLPVTDDTGTRDVPPVVWRTGQRSTEPHLLALGRPAAGTTTLLRSVALQALPHGDVLLIDGSGTGEYSCLLGREGVLAVESSPAGALATLEWACHETERRILTAHHARQQGRPVPEDVRRPLWILVDRPSALSHLAAGEGRPDPQEFLQVPLRHGRVANVTVAVAEHLDNAGLIIEPVLAQTRARVVLGAVTPGQVRTALGAPPPTTPPPDVPPGRGYARLGSGPVLRVQVPATPDPYAQDTSEYERRAVLELLPEPCVPVPYATEPQGPPAGAGYPFGGPGDEHAYGARPGAGHPDGEQPAGGHPDGAYPDSSYPAGGHPDGAAPAGGYPDVRHPGGAGGGPARLQAT